MNNTRVFLVICFLLVVLGAGAADSGTVPAAGAGKESAVQVGPGVSLVMKQVARTVPPVKGAGKDALPGEVELRYPELTCTSGDHPAVAVINKAMKTRMLSMFEDKQPGSPEQLADLFLQDYERSFAEAPESIGGWFLKFQTTVKHADEELLCLETLDSVFTGGAHPNSAISYLVFSLKTGEPLPLTAFVPEARTADLTKVAEAHFRKAREMKPGETFEQAGFNFEQNRFALNQNFLVSKAGLAFCFNPYEIGPYAMGTTELLIPWSDLKGIADAAGPAGRFLKP